MDKPVSPHAENIMTTQNALSSQIKKEVINYMGVQDEAARKTIDMSTAMAKATAEGVNNFIELIMRLLEGFKDSPLQKELNKIMNPEDRKPDIRKVADFAFDDVCNRLDKENIVYKKCYSKVKNGAAIPYIITSPTQRNEINAVIDNMYAERKNVSRIKEDSFFVSKNQGKKLFSINVDKNQALLLQQEARKLHFTMSSTKQEDGSYKVSVLENDYNKLMGAMTEIIPDVLDVQGQVKSKYFKIWNDEIDNAKLLLSENKEFYVLSSATYIGDSFDRDKMEYIHVNGMSFEHIRGDIPIRSEDKQFCTNFDDVFDMQLNDIKHPIIFTKEEFESLNLEDILKDKKQEKQREINEVVKESGLDISFDRDIKSLVQYYLLFKDKLNINMDDVSKEDYISGKTSTEQLIGINDDAVANLMEENFITQDQLNILTNGLRELEIDEDIRDNFYDYLSNCENKLDEISFNVESNEISFEEIKERSTIESIVKSVDELNTNIDEFDWDSKNQEKE